MSYPVIPYNIIMLVNCSFASLQSSRKDKKDASMKLPSEASEVQLECEERVTEESDNSDNETYGMNTPIDHSSANSSNDKSPPYSPVKIVGVSGQLQPSQHSFIQRPIKKKMTFTGEATLLDMDSEQGLSRSFINRAMNKHGSSATDRLINQPATAEQEAETQQSDLTASSTSYRSNHSISELLKPKQHIGEAKHAFNPPPLYPTRDNSSAKRVSDFFESYGRRQTDYREFFTDDLPRRAHSFDGMPQSVAEYSDRAAQLHDFANPHHYKRRAHTPIIPTTTAFHMPLVSGSAVADKRFDGKFSCRSAGSTPLSSPGAFVDKNMFFPREGILKNGSPTYMEMESVSQCSSPNKAVLKRQRDDGMER